MKKQYRFLLLLLITLSISFSGVAQVYNLGVTFQANSVSNDGTIVAGSMGDNNVIWTEAGGIAIIGGITNGYPMSGRATISGDGTKISATITNPDNDMNEMGLYDVTTSSWFYLGGIGGQSDGSVSSAWSISRDGSTVVGLGWINGGTAHAIKWNATDGTVDMGSTVANRSSRANDVSNDGSVIVGWQDGVTGFRQGAVWANGTQTLITDASGNEISEAGAVSGNGVWVVGGGSNFEAWRWSSDTGIINIPHPNSGMFFNGSATAVNEDGSIIVGFYRPWPGPALMGEGFIWTETTGRVELNEYVASFGIDTQGITFSLPLGMSSDGSSIVGYGLSGGNPVGFLIKLPLAPINDGCENAIVLNCSDIVTGSTANASNNGGNDSPDVFYTYTGNGTPELITISLCSPNTNFNTVLRVFSSCDLSNEIAFNDNECGDQSEVSFESDGESTYYIMVEGSSETDLGEFTLEISCEELMSTQEHLFNQLSIYPNPAGDILNLDSAIDIENLTIYNVNGQLVYSQTNLVANQSINISALKSGVYFVRIKNDNVAKTLRLIKK